VYKLLRRLERVQHSYNSELRLFQRAIVIVAIVFQSNISAGEGVPEKLEFSPEVEVYGNYETAGVIFSVPSTIPSSEIGRLSCDHLVGEEWRRVQDPVRIGKSGKFATSLFWLQPGTMQVVRVRAEDQKGGMIATWFGRGETRVEPKPHDSKRIRYVATSGDDGNAGTAEAPFRTISKACKVVRPGETIQIRSGRYHEGDIEVGLEGTEEAPISIIGGGSGGRVIIDASDDAFASPEGWEDLGNNIYRRDYADSTSCACAVDKRTGEVIRLFPVATLKELRLRELEVPADIKSGGGFASLGIRGGIFTGGGDAVIALPDRVENYQVRLPRFSRGLTLNRSKQVRISGIEFECFGSGENNTAVFLRDSSDVTIEGCVFRNCNSYVYLKGESHRVTVQDCGFSDSIIEWPFDYMKRNEAVGGQFEGGAVNIDASYSGRGLVFRRNRISGLFDGCHLTPWREDTAVTNETDFYQNEIEGCIDDFIEADGFSRNLRIFDNRMRRSLTGISLAQALDGPSFVIYNQIIDCGVVSAAKNGENYGYPFKLNGGPQADVGSGEIFLYHNTAYTSDPQSHALLIKNAKWKRLTFRNNIWCGQAAGFALWPKDSAPIDWDFDDLFVTDRSVPLVIQGYRKKSALLVDVQRNHGWMRHGLNSDPQFRDVSKQDFSLNKSSPCVDAGEFLPGINEGRSKGSRPDLGAVESH